MTLERDQLFECSDEKDRRPMSPTRKDVRASKLELRAGSNEASKARNRLDGGAVGLVLAQGTVSKGLLSGMAQG